MTTITAQSILASKHVATPSICRVDTLLLRYPRWIHSELMTHRVFSRNASSSRAIPIEKLIAEAVDNPAVPLFWGKNQRGMQAGEECNEPILVDGYPNYYDHGTAVSREKAWLLARDKAVEMAQAFAKAGYHKQLVNRLLEPFTHITVVVSSTEWSNFLALRDHPDAEPHIRMLAQRIDAALEHAEPQYLEEGEWHLPFVTEEDRKQASEFLRLNEHPDFIPHKSQIGELLIKLSVARCASTSYKTVDGYNMTFERALALHDKLVGSTPLHASPCEHVCQADIVKAYRACPGTNDTIPVWKNPEQHGNFVGFRQYRKMLPNECL